MSATTPSEKGCAPSLVRGRTSSHLTDVRARNVRIAELKRARGPDAHGRCGAIVYAPHLTLFGTGVLRPLLRETARDLGVSRSTVAREMVNLRASGLVESVFVPDGRGSGVTYYRLR